MLFKINTEDGRIEQVRSNSVAQFLGAEAHPAQPRALNLAGGGVGASVSTTYVGLAESFGSMEEWRISFRLLSRRALALA